MKSLKRIAIAAALSSIAFTASAMTPIADTELGLVTGQDGVSIAANLNVNIGSFVYGTPNGTEGGGNVAFNNIAITGTIAATLDILAASKFVGPTGGEAFSVLGLVAPTTAAGSTALLAFYPGTDVVRIAVPDLSTTKLLNITVGSITMGTAGVQNTTNPSFGSFAMNNINLAGTTAYIWAH
ncbi:hypothetical protein AAKU58_000473 [Oxalobacteraceae bacterium GrIS 1.18]